MGAGEPQTDDTFRIVQRKDRKTMTALYEDWYGEGAETVLAGHLPKPVPVADVLKKLSKQLMPPWTRAMEQVKAHWAEIVGPSGAKHLEPLRIDGSVLLVELRHPAYRMAFDTPKMKRTVIDRINEVAGEQLCSEIRFTAPGMFAPVRKK